MSKSVIRSVKNVTKGYSSVQVKVRNATSNDPWGPTGGEMSEVAAMTFDAANFYEIMDMIDKRLNDKGKNWRHVLKALKVLDYCLHEGAETVVTWAQKNIYIIKTLREFIYIDENGKDNGATIRSAAKEITSLLLDDERLKRERGDRKSWKSRVTGLEEYGPSSGPDSPTGRKRERPNRRDAEEDAEFRLALEASKYEAEEDAKRRANPKAEPEDADLAKAIKLSKEEEELRRKELDDQNLSLFDDTPVANAQTSIPTGANQGYGQGGAVNWLGEPIEQPLQTQPTAYLNNMYGQPGAFGSQQTGIPNGFPNQNPLQANFDQALFGQPQQPNYTAANQQNVFAANPYAQQQQQQQQPDYSAFHQQQLQPQTQAQPQFQQQQTQAFQQSSSLNPWASNDGQADALKPLATGSNNPFASGMQRPHSAQGPPKQTLATLAEETQKYKSQFGNSSFNPPTQFQPQQQQPPKEQNPQHARLNALLASGEGQDTFGNVGNLRIPAQHTAPGTFVNSSGRGLESVQPAATGNNPFLNSQFTGMPQLQQRVMPAATGPAGMNGYSSPYGAAQQSNNPFGQPPQAQYQQHPGGSLIDL